MGDGGEYRPVTDAPGTYVHRGEGCLQRRDARGKHPGQDEVFAFLADPATHGLSEPVKRIDTHAAAVFLAGPDAYKVKRAVHFPFMDQSTLERRHASCEAELRVNRAFTPALYLGLARSPAKMARSTSAATAPSSSGPST